MNISPEQYALEAWWNEDPQMRRIEIMCGESYRINVRLWQISMDPSLEAGEDKVAEFEAGTLLDAINGAIANVAEVEPRDPAGWEGGFAANH